MRLSAPLLPVLAAFALCACLLPASPVAADEAADVESAARAYAREQLIRSAKLTGVNPADRDAGALDELKQALEAKRALHERLTPKELARADLLLGKQGEDGLIREAARLYRWFAGVPAEGETPPTLVLSDPADPTKSFAIASTADLAQLDPEVFATWRLDVKRERPDGLIELAPQLPQLRAAAAVWQSLVAAAGSERQPAGADQAWLDPRILALVEAGELRIGLCKLLMDVRERQVELRLRRFQDEQPQRGLVNDRAVAEKAARAERLRERATEFEKGRAALLDALDRMARAERMLKEDSGRLGFLIDEARGAAAAKKDEAAKDDEGKGEAKGDGKGDAPPQPAAVDETLAKLQFEEIVDEQQLRLLYIAVRRAALLLDQYAEAVQHAKEEALGAAEAHKRFEAELSRMRRDRQLERLAWQASELRREEKEARETSTSASEADRALHNAYAAALGRLLALNELTREAVTLRRALEARAKPECDPARPGAAAAANAEGCLPPEAPPLAGPKPDVVAPDASGPKDPLRRFREPRKETIDANFVRDASAMLDHPAWSAELAARHFVAVDDRIAALESALTLATRTAPLRARFETEEAAADAALSEVYGLARKQSLLWRWHTRVRERRQKNLEADRTAFKETLRGVEEERARVLENLVVFREYRQRLLDLGKRSFRIRVQRTLDPDRLGAAYDDVESTLGRTGRWLTLRGDEHAGTFVERNWAMLSICLAILVASFFVVRIGRRMLDRRLDDLASRVPSIQTKPITVRGEEAQAKREKAEQEAAAKAAEEEALRQVSKDEADRQQRVTEGGIAGGGGA